MRALLVGLLFSTSIFAACNANANNTAAGGPPVANQLTPNSAAPAAPETAAPATSPDSARAMATPEAPAARAEAAPVAVREEVRYREVTIPAGTTLRLALTSSVSSKASSVEDAVNATLRSPLVVDGLTVVPSGAAVSGHVTEAKESGRVKGRARIGFRFTSLRADDTRYDIRTAGIAREARGTKKKDAVKIGVGAGAGAVVGAIAGGKKGAAIGSAVGGGAGTGVVLATRGEEVALGPGAIVTTRLTAPLTVRVRVP